MYFVKEYISIFSYIIILFLSKFHSKAFELTGSEFAFVKLEEWKPCRNGSIHLEFKTTFENVLLLYTDDGGIKDYFELKLLKGILNLVFELGSGPMRMAVGEHLSDNQWHKVKIIHQDTNISLHVDDSSRTRQYQGKDQIFGIPNKKNNFVFIGGISKDYEDRTKALTKPSIFFEIRFNGFIRNILYSNCGSPLFRPKILDSLNMTKLFPNECITKNPCLHNGVCLEQDSGVTCDCSYTNFRGDKCEIEKTPTEVTLQGSEYLMYNLVRNDSDDVSQSTKDNIDLYFRTQQPNGLLFFIGDTTDHIIISLRNGGIFVRVNLGSGPYEGNLLNNGYKFDDNQWHHLVVKRDTREIEVIVDGTHRLDGTTLGPYSMLKTNTLFVGGSPHSLYKNRVDVNFKGCLKKVLYNSDKISMDVTTMAMDGDLTVVGKAVFNQCQDMVITKPITFTTPDSYIVIPGWEVGIHGGSLSFEFQTNEQSGIILYNHGLTKFDFFAFEILDGYLNFLINLGSGTEKVKMKYVSDGMLHSVSLHHGKKTGYLLLDGHRIDYAVAGESTHLDLHSKLFVGGIDKDPEARPIPKELWAGILSSGFVGCIHDLVMNGNKVDLLTAASTQRIMGIKNYCRVMNPQCNPGSCLHRGTCNEGWNRYLCDCRGTGYTGPICQTGATTLEFDGTQFLRITMEDSSKTQAEDISLRFRTRRQNGLLLITSSDHSPDKMELCLKAGSVRLDIKIGQSSKALTIGNRLNDDAWHTIYIKRRGEIIHLKVDNANPIEEHLQLELTLHIKHLVLGNVAPMLSDEYIQNEEDFTKADIRRMQQEDSALRSHTSFVGAMQQFIFNGNHYFDLAKTRKIENIEVTAKFDTDEPVLKFPVTFKSEDSYVSLPPLNANTQFSIYLKFKTTESDGLILYNGGEQQDFLALELQGGNLLYIYDTGNGPRRILVNAQNKLNDNMWHDVSLIRTSIERQLIRVDNNPPTMEDMTEFSSKHFNLDGDLYIGGVDKMMLNTLPSRISSRRGFLGCMGSIDLNGMQPNLFDAARGMNNGVVEDCQGPSSGCKPDSCHNYGRCVLKWNSYECDCDMTSFTGSTCTEESTSYSFGVGGGLITYERPKENYYDTTQDQFALGFSTAERNALIFRVESNSSKDFIELSLTSGNILITYNMGTKREIPIGETLKTFNDRKYHVIRFRRSGSNATLHIDNDQPIVKIPAGHQQRWNIFNNQARIYVGGDRKHRSRMIPPFRGTIAGLNFNGVPILKKAAEGDRRITIEGNVRLNRREIIASTRETRKLISRGNTFHSFFMLNDFKLATIDKNNINHGKWTSLNRNNIVKREITDSDTEDNLLNTDAEILSDDQMYIPLRTNDPAASMLPNQFDNDIILTDDSLTGSIDHFIPVARQSLLLTTISNKVKQHDPTKYPKDRGRSSIIIGTEPMTFQFSHAQTTPVHGLADEIIVSTEDSTDCISDDEDDCTRSSGEGSVDDIIIPTSTIITFSTPKPPETPEPSPPSKINHICEDGVEGCSESFGFSGRDTTQSVLQVVTTLKKDMTESDSDDGKKKLALIIGIAVGVLFTIIILIIALYKFRSRDEGTYKVDESKNFAYLESKNNQGNGAIIGASNIKSGKKKDVKEWYV